MKERAKERWVEHFEKVLNRTKSTRKDKGENENFVTL